MALTVAQLDALTQKLIIPKVVDNIFKSNVLFFRLKERGIQYRGGSQIQFPVVYAKNSAVGAFSKYDVLATSPNDQITAGVLDWKRYYVHLSISNHELDLNDGKTGIVDLLEALRQNAELSLLDKLGDDLYKTSPAANELDGFGKIMSATSVYAGIDPADMATWKAVIDTTAISSLTLLDLQKGYGKVTIGSDQPTIGVTNQAVFDKIWSLAQTNQRFFNSRLADAGFDSIGVNGKPVVVDQKVAGSGAGTADNHFYWLNERWLYLAIHSNRNFVTERIPVQPAQDVYMQRIVVMLNLVCSQRRQQMRFEAINPA